MSEWDSATTTPPPEDFKRAQRKKSEAQEDRLPPHSIEAEQGVLGCILLSPEDCIGTCIEKLKAGGECFYDLRHRSIYDALVEKWGKSAHTLQLIDRKSVV